MKDKSRFLSSVIVSLLAGFIFYMFDQDITKDVQSSVLKVLSSNDIEEYILPDCMPFNSITKTTDKKINKKKSKFYIKKRNTIEFRKQDVVVPGDELFSDYITNNPAKFQRPVPDRNIDFTSELDQLIKNDLSRTGLKPGKENKISKSLSSSDDKLADTRGLRMKRNNFDENYEVYQNKFKSAYKKKGNGFEYNIMVPGNPTAAPVNPLNSRSESESENNSDASDHSTMNNYEMKSECEQFNIEFKTKTSIINGKKVKIVTPKIHIQTEQEDIDSEPQEINVEDDSECDGSM